MGAVRGKVPPDDFVLFARVSTGAYKYDYVKRTSSSKVKSMSYTIHVKTATRVMITAASVCDIRRVENANALATTTPGANRSFDALDSVLGDREASGNPCINGV